MSEPDVQALVEEQARRGGRTARVVLAAIFTGSLLLGVVLLANYGRLLHYVRDTLERPTGPRAWEMAVLDPEGCVDAALDWAAECSGIKTFCDEYVGRVMGECLASQDRREYCAAVGDAASVTTFGHAECTARGVERGVDAEACANAYRGIDAYCSRLALELQPGERIPLSGAF